MRSLQEVLAEDLADDCRHAGEEGAVSEEEEVEMPQHRGRHLGAGRRPSLVATA